MPPDRVPSGRVSAMKDAGRAYAREPSQFRWFAEPYAAGRRNLMLEATVR
jgi:hypothetical protein